MNQGYPRGMRGARVGWVARALATLILVLVSGPDFKPGDILAHRDMCDFEGVAMLQRGMTFRAPPNHGIILMSQRENAPYSDALDDDGNLRYEGHDTPSAPGIEPKLVDQPRYSSRGTPTDNGKFADWTDRYKAGAAPPARFHVFEKLRKGIWSFRGPFLLRDYEFVSDGRRRVFRFVLQAMESSEQATPNVPSADDLQRRAIPTWVKVAVYQRDKGRCVECGAKDQLHFDHDLPYSLGGASATPKNVQLMCARHNLSKGARLR